MAVFNLSHFIFHNCTDDISVSTINYKTKAHFHKWIFKIIKSIFKIHESVIVCLRFFSGLWLLTLHLWLSSNVLLVLF